MDQTQKITAVVAVMHHDGTLSYIKDMPNTQTSRWEECDSRHEAKQFASLSDAKQAEALLSKTMPAIYSRSVFGFRAMALT